MIQLTSPGVEAQNIPVEPAQRVNVNAKHSSRSSDWVTPLDVVERARRVLDGIDLDPASDPWANELIKADVFLTKEDNGLTCPWFRPHRPKGSVFLNPPGGRLGRESLPVMFWNRLVQEVVAKNVTHAIFVGFSIEILQTAQTNNINPLQFPICVPRKRLKFIKRDNANATTPTHANVIVYLPGIVDRTAEFVKEFSSLGQCVVPNVLP